MAKSLNQFLQSVEKRAYKQALIACGCRSEALDIVQETMFSLVKMYGDKTEEHWEKLFHRILQNKINDWYRSQGTRRRIFDWWADIRDEQEREIGDFFEDSTSLPPETQLAQNQTIMGIEKALEALSFRQRQVFILRAWQGYSTKESAEIMSCTEGSVKKHYARALSNLKDSLEVNKHHE